MIYFKQPKAFMKYLQMSFDEENEESRKCNPQPNRATEIRYQLYPYNMIL